MDTHAVSSDRPVEPRRLAGPNDYLALTRLDHSTKQIFIVPGIAFAYLLRGVQVSSLGMQISLGLITSICIASANYVVNEYLDREFDRHHPTKSRRKAVQCQMHGAIIALIWLGLISVGLASALTASLTMFVIACAFGLQGIIYNVYPIRTKDKPYLDVLSESINNPIRLMIGWTMVDPTTLPPSSIILSYWLGGAFLMAAKRYSEYRDIVASYGRALLVQYRASFGSYSDVSLNTSCFIYGLSSTFFLAIFLIKYRIEYVLLMPGVIILFGYYLSLAMRSGSVAQNPEKLLRQPQLVVLVVLLAAGFVVTTWVDVPGLTTLSAQKYITVR